MPDKMTLADARALAKEAQRGAQKDGPLYVIGQNGLEYAVRERDRGVIQEWNEDDLPIEDYAIGGDDLLIAAIDASTRVPALAAAALELVGRCENAEGQNVVMTKNTERILAERDAALARVKELEKELKIEKDLADKDDDHIRRLEETGIEYRRQIDKLTARCETAEKRVEELENEIEEIIALADDSIYR